MRVASNLDLRRKKEGIGNGRSSVQVVDCIGHLLAEDGVVENVRGAFGRTRREGHRL